MPSDAAKPRRKSAAQAKTTKAGPKRDPDATRQRILDAAIREFSAQGYSGARVDMICKRARANPRMIYHYFGDKDGLYVTVLEHVLGDLRREELKLEVDHVQPLTGMLQLFNFVHAHFGAHPELIALLSGENLQRARFLRRSVKAPIVASPLIELIGRLLERGVKQGEFRAGIDPLQLYVMMVALSYFHRSNAHTLSVLFRTDLLEPTWQSEQKRAADQMLARYLERNSPRGAE
ncbi:MAG TPA: TetR/AcrR family transcriptional regulator [Polyangiaceae bacterium]|jgi:AcrR family transcriptional regulator|nr:TetR/AcrR family transcriptional regulator [Polyangiaceae bacterium]